MKPRSVVPMRLAKIGYIFISALITAIGVVFILRPKVSIDVLGMVCGLVMLAFGVIKLVGYFSKDLYRLAFQFDREFGAVLIIIGLCIAAHPDRLMTFFCVLMGVFALADGFLKIRIASQAKDFGLSSWPAIAAFAILSCIAGVLLMFWPEESSVVMFVLFGICLVTEGILNICVALFTVKIVPNQQPDSIDSKYREAEYTEIE